MSEAPVSYLARGKNYPPAQLDLTRDKMFTELYALRAELEELERRLIPLLVTVQRALGKEPSVNTRAERRRR